MFRLAGSARNSVLPAPAVKVIVKSQMPKND